MRRITSRAVARMLAGRPAPEPPVGLSGRIKAEIPGTIRLERPVPHPGRPWLSPPLVEGFHPSWLAAASLLLVLGVGFVAARIPTHPDDVWKWIALNGVVHIDDVVVTAPAPRETKAAAVALAAPAARAPRVARERRAAATSPDDLGIRKEAAPAPPVAADAARAAAPPREAPVSPPAGETMGALELTVSDGQGPLPGATVVAARSGPDGGGGRMAVADRDGRASFSDLPAGEYRVRSEAPGFRPLETTADVEAGATSRLDVTMPQVRVAEAPPLEAAPAPVAAGASRRLAGAAVRGPDDEGAVTVIVRDEVGLPCAGVEVTLDRLGQGASWERSGRTDAAGVVVFLDVPSATYGALATGPSVAPARKLVSVASGSVPTRVELQVARRTRR